MRFKPLSVFSLAFSLFGGSLFAQKKPLDHTVYDSWQSINSTNISKDGKVISYVVGVQEGDGKLYLQYAKGDTLMVIDRGYAGSFLPNGKYFVCKIKPTFDQTRKAKIAKKKEDEMPKDSLAIVDIEKNSVSKIPNIRSFKVSEKEGNLLAWLSEKPIHERTKPDSLAQLKSLENQADSLNHLADSLRGKLAEAKTNGLKVLRPRKDHSPKPIKPEGFDLHYWNTSVPTDSATVSHVLDYTISPKNASLAYVLGARENDSIRAVVLVNQNKQSTVLTKFQSVKNLTFDELGKQLAFVVDLDSSKTALRNFYKLYLFQTGNDSARNVADRYTKGIPTDNQISENARLYFSKSAKRLFFGTAPILPLPDTTLPEFERVKVDVWHYQEDELHTAQLYNLERDLKKSFLAMYTIDKQQVIQLADDNFRRVSPTFEGDGTYFYASTDTGRRVAMQWTGRTASDIYRINAETGEKVNIAKNLIGNIYPSYTGKYLLLYNAIAKNYSLYNSTTGSSSLVKIPTPVYDVENDVPAEPQNYGIAGWSQSDDAVYVYDQYDIWKVATANTLASLAIPSGRKSKINTQYVALDRELEYLPTDSVLAFNQYHELTKNNQYVLFSLQNPTKTEPINVLGTYRFADLDKAKDADVFSFTRQNFQQSPNIFVEENGNAVQLSNINPQQSQYSWGTAELYKWKTYTGKETEGILYKPEDFDPTKKYPLIAYFYERNNETLYNYQAPSPTPSRLNIPFFVSRGYVVFVPDIWYQTGHPGESAYNYIVSGVRSLVKKGFIDSTKMGIQGQSWGGYQTAFLITRVPNMFAAAWAGAPVVDMFSAYGGIRWQSGMNRQFQYEKTQSRIGATIWDKPELYVENSPMFKLNKVKTPVVIMANDADGAVPWYQGIEMFTDLRRLQKPVWMLNYNGEAHNLVERRNRKDIQIREQEFFDWLLKGAKPAPWIEKGVPAVMKGRTWGL